MTLTVAAAAALAAAVIFALTSHGSRHSPARVEHGSVDVAGDIYPYLVYVPAGYSLDGRAALVVVLHGCNTTADQQVAASQYDDIAARHRFVVLYPDVDSVDQVNGRCWKGIWNPGAEQRGGGDAAAIADMTRTVISRWHTDRTRVYAIGISAGAFETSMLAADYPDLYAAVGVHSGAAYMGGQPGCLAGTQSPADTEALARAALAAMGPRARVVPVIVFHGDADGTIPYGCGQQTVAQWLRTDDLVLERERRPTLSATPTTVRAVVPRGHAYTVASYPGGNGCPVAQLWTIHGMGHFWSGGSAGRASARFSDPKGPSAAAASWAFFSRWLLSTPVPRCTSARG